MTDRILTWHSAKTDLDLAYGDKSHNPTVIFQPNDQYTNPLISMSQMSATTEHCYKHSRMSTELPKNLTKVLFINFTCVSIKANQSISYYLMSATVWNQ